MTNLIVDNELARRRWPELKRAMKQWICDRCGALITRMTYYQYSRSHDGEREIKLCLDCSKAVPAKERQ